MLFTTSPGKVEDGKRLGAHEVVVSKNADEMKKHAGSFDFILDAVSAEHDINAYLRLLKLDGTLVPGRRAGEAAAGRGVQPAAAAPQFRRLGHRRHR